MNLVKFNAGESEIWINKDVISAIYPSDEGVTIDTNGYKYWITESIEEVMEKIQCM